MKKINITFKDKIVIKYIKLYKSFETIQNMINDCTNQDIYLNINYNNFSIIIDSLLSFSENINDNNIIELVNDVSYLYNKKLLNKFIKLLIKEYPHKLQHIDKNILKHLDKVID